MVRLAPLSALFLSHNKLKKKQGKIITDHIFFLKIIDYKQTANEFNECEWELYGIDIDTRLY